MLTLNVDVVKDDDGCGDDALVGVVIELLLFVLLLLLLLLMIGRVNQGGG